VVCVCVCVCVVYIYLLVLKWEKHCTLFQRMFDLVIFHQNITCSTSEMTSLFQLKCFYIMNPTTKLLLYNTCNC